MIGGVHVGTCRMKTVEDTMKDDAGNIKQLLVHVALYVDVDSIGKRGADHLHGALEAMAGVAAKGLMDTHSGVRSWVASRHPSPEFVVGVSWNVPDEGG